MEGSIKFRLSTLLLGFAVIAIAAGWLLDRQRLAHHYQIREEQLETSIRVLSKAQSNAITAAQFRLAPDEFGDAVTKRLMMDVIMIYNFRTDILESGEQPGAAARMTLATLDCKTAEQFLALADSVQFNETIGDLMLKSAIENQESRGELVAFIENSLSANK